MLLLCLWAIPCAWTHADSQKQAELGSCKQHAYMQLQQQQYTSKSRCMQPSGTASTHMHASQQASKPAVGTATGAATPLDVCTHSLSDTLPACFESGHSAKLHWPTPPLPLLLPLYPCPSPSTAAAILLPPRWRCSCWAHPPAGPRCHSQFVQASRWTVSQGIL